MKKGDVIGKKKEILEGDVLLRNLESREKGEKSFDVVQELFNVQIPLRVEEDKDNPGAFCIVAAAATLLLQQAKVNWVVDYEAGITFLDSGGSVVLDTSIDTDWIVLQEAPPEYQDSVEHMTDEQLRESIEALRIQRISRPEATRTRVKVEKAPSLSPQDKKLNETLQKMSPEQKLELQRKLGLID